MLNFKPQPLANKPPIKPISIASTQRNRLSLGEKYQDHDGMPLLPQSTLKLVSVALIVLMTLFSLGVLALRAYFQLPVGYLLERSINLLAYSKNSNHFT